MPWIVSPYIFTHKSPYFSFTNYSKSKGSNISVTRPSDYFNLVTISICNLRWTECPSEQNPYSFKILNGGCYDSHTHTHTHLYGIQHYRFLHKAVHSNLCSDSETKVDDQPTHPSNPKNKWGPCDDTRTFRKTAIVKFERKNTGGATRN